VKFSEFDTRTATVRCEPSGREVQVVHESNLLDAILRTGMALGQACDGIALCGFCRVRILEGAENLTPIGEEERKILAAEHADDEERLACCTRVHGPVAVTTDYW
jgi:ferredoxin